MIVKFFERLYERGHFAVTIQFRRVGLELCNGLNVMYHLNAEASLNNTNERRSEILPLKSSQIPNKRCIISRKIIL